MGRQLAERAWEPLRNLVLGMEQTAGRELAAGGLAVGAGTRIAKELQADWEKVCQTVRGHQIDRDHWAEEFRTDLEHLAEGARQTDLDNQVER